MTLHEHILEEAFLDEDRLRSPEVQGHLAECAACRERLDDLQRLSRELDVVATEEQEDLGRAMSAASEDAGLTPGFEALLEQHRSGGRASGAASGPAPTSVSRLRPLQMLVAAAAVLAIVFFGRELITTDPNVDSGGNELMGDERLITLVRPVTMDPLTLEWEYDLPPQGRFVLTILDLNGAVLVEETVQTNRWSPSDMVIEVELPDAFRLRIEALDHSGHAVGELPEVQLP